MIYCSTLWVCAFFKGIGSTAKAVRIQVAQLKRERNPMGFLSLFSWIFTFPPNLPLTKGGLFRSGLPAKAVPSTTTHITDRLFMVVPL